MGAIAVDTLLRSVELRAIGLSLGVRQSCAVSAPGFVFIVPANMAKLVASEAPVDSEVGRIRLAVKDLGLLYKATLA